MAYHIVIEERAKQDIRLAVHWLSVNATPRVAEEWSQSIYHHIATLKTHPRCCPLAAENGRFKEELCSLIHGKGRSQYRILFTVSEKTVHILFVQHNARGELL